MADVDVIQQWANAVGIRAKARTVIVEGRTDEDLFELAGRLYHRATGVRLIDDNLAISAAGDGDDGGTQGVIRKLHAARELSRACLKPNGRPRYRFIALFDNDSAGQRAIRAARELDRNLLEYRDVFRLWPIMPSSGSLDSESLRKATEAANQAYRGMDCEIEDLLSDNFIEAFCGDEPTAVSSSFPAGNRTHRNFTRDGKSRLHRFTKQYAMADDVVEVTKVLVALRFYLGLPTIA